MEDRSGRQAISTVEAQVRQREGAPEAVGELFSSWLSSMGGTVRDTARAARVWYFVNGDIERSHTCGVYVSEPRGRQKLPTLVVYVDSRSRVTDFTANREIYRVRLEQAGLRFSEIVFRESKRPREEVRRKMDKAPVELPALTPEEDAMVERALEDVPEDLRSSVAQAMRMSMRAEKRRNS